MKSEARWKKEKTRITRLSLGLAAQVSIGRCKSRDLEQGGPLMARHCGEKVGGNRC